MIAYIQGILLEKTDNSCLLLTAGGVGYEIFLSAHTLAGLPQRIQRPQPDGQGANAAGQANQGASLAGQAGQAGQAEQGGLVRLYVHTQVREDALELFGFETWDERETFQTLISINRVGARTAMAVLGVYRPDGLRRLVLDEDVNGLTLVPGIGKKTAQQIFLELKFKLKLDGVPGSSAAAGGTPGVSAGGPGRLARDAVAGLANLGYAEDEAAFVVKEVLAAEPDLDLGGILRSALKRLAKRV
jgi:Holliday junction DNA helicase RuvA